MNLYKEVEGEESPAGVVYVKASLGDLSKAHPKCRTCRFSKINTSLGHLERKYVGHCAYEKSTVDWFSVEFDVDYCGRHNPDN